jgi:phosphoserine phosphatase RsbU/P
MTSVSQTTPEMTLATVNGPELLSWNLNPSKRYTIGHRSDHPIALMHDEAKCVSRVHAELFYRTEPRGGEWFIIDLGSRHGTRVNGISLEANRECPVKAGDLIEIAPYTFALRKQGRESEVSRVSTVDDGFEQGSTVTSLRGESGLEMAQERLRLLLKCAEALQTPTTLQNLVDITLDAAMAGTGYRNACVAGPMSSDGVIELMAARGEIGVEQGGLRLSRSLIRAASNGTPAQMIGASGIGELREAMSIAQFGIQEAICVPLMTGTTVAGYLYLDHRKRSHGSREVAAQEAAAFAVGIGRLASMAWANLSRIELEKRFAYIQGELAAAAEIQQSILPSRNGAHGTMSYVGECRPGRTVSGDFFDVIPLTEDRVAIALGDVSGKGIAASVLMTTAVGMLNGSLKMQLDTGGDADPSRAVAELAKYVVEHNVTGRFLTLWLGVFDLKNRTLTYVDAGHGYAWFVDAKRDMSLLDDCGGAAVGTDIDANYTCATVSLTPGGRVVVVSDGIIEQPSQSKHERIEFGKHGLECCIKSMQDGSDEVKELFAAVEGHAGQTALADDATVVVVRW